MLETQKFLNKFGLDAISQPPLNILVKRRPDFPNLVHFTYSQLESPKAHPVVLECRGLILDEADNWNVVAYPFRRFANYGEEWANPIDWSTARVQDKLDGCHLRTAKLHLWDGNTTTIGEVVSKQLPVTLIGMDKNGDIVPCTVTNWFNNGRKTNWVEIETSCPPSHNHRWSGKCHNRSKRRITINHEVRTSRGYCLAGELTLDDTLYTYEEALTPAALHTVRAGLLGDGSILRAGDKFVYTTGHKLEHTEYTEIQQRWLGPTTTNIQTHTSGYGTIIKHFQTRRGLSRQISSLRDEWYPNGIKAVPQDLSWMDDFAVAVWFMDDGSLNHNSQQQDRACFATNSFSWEDCQRLADRLKQMYGVDAVVFDSKGPNIRINAGRDPRFKTAIKMLVNGDKQSDVAKTLGLSRSTVCWLSKQTSDRYNADSIDVFWEAIAPHMTPCMRYKLPMRFRSQPVETRDVPQKFWVETETSILSIKYLDSAATKFIGGSVGFDIETTTGNYFCNGLLVHNSMITLFNYKDSWLVSMKGNPAGRCSVGLYDVTFEELFWKTFAAQGLSTGALEYGMTYVWELTSVANRVVCEYSEPQVTLIGWRYNFNLTEWPVSMATWLPTVREYNMSSYREVMSAAEVLNPMQHEGYVVVDAAFNRVKIKSPKYVLIHHMKDGFGQRRILGLIRLGEESEVLAHFPEYRAWYDEVKAKVDEFCQRADQEYEAIQHIESQKEFAFAAQKCSNFGYMMDRRKGKFKNCFEYLFLQKWNGKNSDQWRHAEWQIEAAIGLKPKELKLEE